MNQLIKSNSESNFASNGKSDANGKSDGKSDANSNEIAVLLKYLSNFWRTLEMTLI